MKTKSKKIAVMSSEAVKRVNKNGKTRVYSDDGRFIMTIGKNNSMYKDEPAYKADNFKNIDIKPDSSWFD